jgi:hypothetical protein
VIGQKSIVAVPDTVLVSESPEGLRWLVPVVAGAAASIAGMLVLVSTRTINFWPITGLVFGVCVAGDRLLALRSASIEVRENELRVRTHLGSRASRRVDELLTIEWHDAGWRPSIVLNFERIADNVKLSAQGFSSEGVEELAQNIGKPFLRGATLYGDGKDPPTE